MRAGLRRNRPLADVDFGRIAPNHRAVSRLAFVRPLSPSAAVRPPRGADWLHEPKWDGFRFQIIKDGNDDVRMYSRHGAEYTDRLPKLVFLAFDLLHQDGVDLRSLSLTERKRDLTRLCRQSRTPFLKQVETFPDGEVLFDHCNKFGFEGVVSKRRALGYSSGLSRHWVKAKCPDWKRINAERGELFEGQRRP